MAVAGTISLQLFDVSFRHEKAVEAVGYPTGQLHSGHGVKIWRFGIHHQKTRLSYIFVVNVSYQVAVVLFSLGVIGLLGDEEGLPTVTPGAKNSGSHRAITAVTFRHGYVQLHHP